MSTVLHYQLVIRNADDDGDLLVISSVPTDDNPYIAEPPDGDGEELDPLTGKVTVGAYTVTVIDAVGDVAVTSVALEDDFESYADSTALLAAWTETDPGGIATWTLDTVNPQTGAKCAKLTLNGSISAGQVYKIARTVGGLTPGDVYTFARGIYADAGNPPFPEDAWFDASTPVTVDGSGNLEVYLRLVVQTGGTATNWHWYFDNVSVTRQSVGASRIVTGSLADAGARQQLLSKKAYLNESTNGGANWTVRHAGYINRVALISPLRYEITVGESRRVEQSMRVFDRIPDPTTQPTLCSKSDGTPISGAGVVLDRASCLIGGPIIGDFGAYRDAGRPIFEVADVDGQYVQLDWVGGPVHGIFKESNPPIRDDVKVAINDAAVAYLDPLTIASALGLQVSPLTPLVARIYNASTGAWIADHVPAARRINESWFSTDWNFTNSDVQLAIRWNGSTPSPGTRYRLAIFPVSIDSRNPFHVTGHPVAIATALLDYAGIAYNATSAATLTAEVGDLTVHLRIEQSNTLQPFLEETLFGPFGFATRLNEAGEQEFFRTRASGQTPVATITTDTLIDAEGTAWELEEATAANRVIWESQSFLGMDAAARAGEFAIDALIAAKVTVNVAAEDGAAQAVFGDREIRFTLPGELAGYATGTAEEPGSLDLFVAAIAGPLFDWQGRGAIRGEFNVLRGTEAFEAIIGQEVVVNCPHIPAASIGQSPTSQRGTFPVRGFVLKKTVHPSGAALYLEQRGLVETLVFLPTFTLAPSATNPSKQVEVTVTNEGALTTAAVTVRVEMQGAVSEPAAGAHVRQFLPGVDANPFDLPPVCAGSVVWVRMRAEGTGAELGQIGPWTAFQSEDLTDMVAPSVLTATAVGATVTLAWTNGEAAIPVEVLYRPDTETLYSSVALLPAGSTGYVFTVPAATTAYTFAVRHVDGACTSAMDTEGVTTEALAVLQPPIDPAAFADGIGHHGMTVTATEIPGTVEFWTATETAVGSATAGTYVLSGTVASAAEGRTSHQSPVTAANDGKLRFWKARHTKDGFTPSAYTDEVSINPWAVLPPNPDPGGDDPTQDQLQAVPFTIAAHTAGPFSWSWGEGELGEAIQPLRLNGYSPEDWFDFSNVGAVIITGNIRETTLPAGAVITWEYTLDDGANWAALGGDAGPFLQVDPDNLMTDGVQDGLWVTVVDAAKTRVRIRPACSGGGSGELFLDRLELQGRAQPLEFVTPENEDPVEEIPPIPGDPPPPAGCNGTDEMPSFAKLIAWVVADCGDYITVGGKVRINFLNDQSGNGNNLGGYDVSGSYAYAGMDPAGNPLTLNSRDVAAFDAAYLQFPAGMMTGVTDATFVIVVYGRNGDPGQAVNYVFSWQFGTSTLPPIYAGQSNAIYPNNGPDGHIRDDFGSDTRHDLGDPSLSLATWRVFTIRAQTNGYRATLDGSEIFNSGTNTVAWATTAKIGGRGANSKLGIAEIAVFNGLTDAELNDVVATVADRWGLTVGGGGAVGGDTGSSGDPGSGTGGGSGGDEEVPAPAPAGGARPYGAYSIPSTGAGVWNSTVKAIRPYNAGSLIDQATAAGMTLFAQLAGSKRAGDRTPGWLNPDGTFSLTKWKQRIDEIADDADVAAAITAGIIPFHYVIDEPNAPNVYGGQAISKSTVEVMCAYSLSIWPTLPCAGRFAPDTYTTDIPSLSVYWAQYRLRRGEPVGWRNSMIAAAQAWGKDLVIGLNPINFGGTGTGSGALERWASAAEYRHYGRIMASHSYPCAFMIWQYEAAWYAQSGMPAAVEDVSDTWTSFD